jgi:hypothetical protein
LIVSLIRGTIFYYLGLLLGMAMLGIYFWIILTANVANLLVYIIFLFTGIVATLTTMGLAAAKTRSGRMGLTTLSGLIGGVHAYLDIVLYPIETYGFWGALLTFWWLCGLMLAGAAVFWLTE